MPFPFAAVAAAIPTVLQIGSSLFGKKETGGESVSATSNLPAWLRAWAKKYGQNYVPGESYSGTLSAGMTSQESTGLDQLTKLLSQPAIGDLFNAGKNQIMSTLSGTYADPSKSPFIQAMTTMSNRTLQDQIDAMRRNRGALGKYFHSETMGDESRLRGNTIDYLNTLVGKFSDEERARMFQAAPIAQAMDEYQMLTAPLTQIGASQTYGSLERTIEQADYDRMYQDYLRKRKEMAGPISLVGGAGMGFNDFTSPIVNQNNALGNILDTIAKLNWGKYSKTGKAGDIFTLANA